VPLAIESSPLDREPARRAGVRAEPRARLETELLARRKRHDDRHFVALRLVALGGDFGVGEVRALAQASLQGEEIAVVGGIAAIEVDHALEQSIIQHVLLEAHRPEAVQRTRVVLEHDVRGRRLGIDVDVLHDEAAVEVAACAPPTR
jgi:hypothetical protein